MIRKLRKYLWPTKPTVFTPQPLSYLNEENRCPDCNATHFIIGPSGGAAVNIKCAGCGNKFWFGPPFTPLRIYNDDCCYTHAPVFLWNEVY